ncbi:YbgA family protein [Microbispora sp. NPDC049125]|uniref:YbgA family protein n=1 Tax=Microbispora sp. NPDC049125 TaxID=3154929 RepID=UPI003464FE68
MRPRIAVSSCLLGNRVRSDGGHSRDRFLSEELSAHVDWVPICPEMEIGLGSPRETLRLERSPRGPRLMTGRSHADLTYPMTALAARHAATLDVDGYVFKSRSPSCGTYGVPVFAGTPVTGELSRGLFAGALIDARPLLAVEDESRLRDAGVREEFMERIFAAARLRTLLAGRWRPRDLVAFHTRHKMQLLAHAPATHRELGRLVARAGAAPRETLAHEYGSAFRAAMAGTPTVGRHVNTMHHCLGLIGHALPPARRDGLLTAIESYRARRVALDVPLALLRRHARGEDMAYVGEQTYLSPYPDELRLLG